MGEKERAIAILAEKVVGLTRQIELTFALLEETQVILEIVSSEIPIHTEMRQQIEHVLTGIRRAISASRACFQPPPPNAPPQES
jgi:predicted transcriptional regulator